MFSVNVYTWISVDSKAFFIVGKIGEYLDSKIDDEDEEENIGI